jgi:[protein-PII] uridylyltransferase
MTPESASASDHDDFSSWFDFGSLNQLPDAPTRLLNHFKSFLKQGESTLKKKHAGGMPAKVLIQARALLVDRLLVRAWEQIVAVNKGNELSLIAVGGYGRKELMPGSDIDLMVLLSDVGNDEINAALESFLTFLWDIGLEVGHSVRTVDDCIKQSLADITVVTNLMESRLLTGSQHLYEEMQRGTAADKIWGSRDFFKAKRDEQVARHNKYHNTAYKLEPNVKEGPGGLRDIQMVIWVTNRHFGNASLEELVENDFLTDQEYQGLIQGRDYLWEVRFALHNLTGRSEDRLLFDYQRTLAEQFGYQDTPDKLGVEAFMKKYYQTIMELSRLNEMLLQLFHEEILNPDEQSDLQKLNNRFQCRNGYLEVINVGVFKRYPFALLEVFLLLEQHPEIKGVRADTIRAIRANVDLIDDTFRQDIRARSLFMEIIRQPHGITHELRRMNTYGVLAGYLPAFKNIVGLMQYDLFHTYTVDEHILFVVRNLRRFTVEEFASEFPLCSKVIATLPKPELVYIAGLFHDIAKGRGGNHSDLGCDDAEQFCINHSLSKQDTQLVVWLVKYHLLMSSTAQRKDIGDPVVVNRFANTVGNAVYLDYLYILTVADIRGTNPELWNSWMDALFRQLYFSTRNALQRGLDDPLQRSESVWQTQEEAKQLFKDDFDDSKIDTLWALLGEEYFLRHSPDQVARHTGLLLSNPSTPLVDIRPHDERGSTEIFVCTEARDDLFYLITVALEQLGLNVVDAGIITTQDQRIVDTFYVLDESGEIIRNDFHINEIRNTLLNALTSENREEWHISRRAPRHYRHFQIKTRIDFRQDKTNQRTIMELVTSDRPGLLSKVGKAFHVCGIRLHNAKIATPGARAEDVYYISDRDNRPLTEDAQFDCLRKTLATYLDQENI